MSYLVLARKWRPKKFADLVGQSHVERTLLNGIKQSRLAHAFLFSGPRGVGKTTAARLLAMALNCKNPDNGEPCGSCEPCTKTVIGNFIDTMEIDAASNTGVEDVRKLRDGIRYSPLEGKAKIYIIDEVHMLSNAAFNALLKTLEEPPNHACFVLATTEIQKVPATILSRCQRFDFRRVTALEIRNHIQHICTVEGIEFDLDGLDVIARRADGSIRDSLSLLDQVIAFTGGKVYKQEVIEIIGEIKYDIFFSAVNLAFKQDPAEAILLDESLASVGTDPMDFVLGLQEFLIQVIQVKAVGADKADIPPEFAMQFDEVAKRLQHADIVRILQHCSTVEGDIRHNHSPRTRQQLLLLKLALMEESVNLKDALDKIGKSGTGSTTPVTKPSSNVTKKSQTSGASTTPVQKNEADSAPKERLNNISGNELEVAKMNWKYVCEKIGQMSGGLIKFGAQPVALNNGTMTILANSSATLDAVKKSQNKILEEYQKYIDIQQIEVMMGDVNVNQEEVVPYKSDDPKVQLLQDILGAKLVN